MVLRNGVEVDDALATLLGFLERWAFDFSEGSKPGSFGEPDLRAANRGGARISAAEIAGVLARRRRIERALREIAPEASLTGAASSVPWLPLGRLYASFAEIRGVGFSKMTKALHPKRPALIPMLDSAVQRHLEDDDPGPQAPFGERALTLTRGYKRDLDRNRRALGALQRELAMRDYALTEVRILDLLIWAAEASSRRE